MMKYQLFYPPLHFFCVTQVRLIQQLWQLYDKGVYSEIVSNPVGLELLLDKVIELKKIDSFFFFFFFLGLTLNSLNLSYNKLTDLPLKLGDLSNLTNLNLSNKKKQYFR